MLPDDGIHNPAPILDLPALIEHVKAGTSTFKDYGSSPTTKKYIEQVTPDVSRLPYCGLSVECGSVGPNLVNEAVAQTLVITVCATIIMDAQTDFTGFEQQTAMFDDHLLDLMHCIYNYQPSKTRYLNGFQLRDFDRVSELETNAYEVYCVYFDIPCRIDYLDGYMTEARAIKSVKAQARLQKLNTSTTFNVVNNSK